MGECSLNKNGYEALIKGDIEWIKKNTKKSLERNHIIAVLRNSVKMYYPDSLECYGL